jgi:hypothetical protein
MRIARDVTFLIAIALVFFPVYYALALFWSR